MAKCRRCGREAEYRVSYAKLWFCRDHFIEYFEERVVDTIRRYDMAKPGDRVLVAVSGGKDSMSLLTVLVKHRDSLGLESIVGLHLNLGIDGYSEMVESIVRNYCGKLGVECIILRLRDLLGASLPEIASRARRPPCSICGLVKRYVFTATAVKTGADAVFTGHHLDDLVRYMLKDIYVGDYESLSTLKPTIRDEGLPIKARPLIAVSEKDIETYAKLAGVPYVEAKCPFKHVGDIDEAVRLFLGKLEEANPGAKLMLLSSVNKLISNYLEPGLKRETSRCRICGMPSSSDICSFCRLTKHVFNEYMGRIVQERIGSMVSREKPSQGEEGASH